MRVSYSRTIAHLSAASCAALFVLCGCSDFQPPVLRSSTTQEAPLPLTSGDSSAAQCEQIRAEIRANQEAVREAPATSTSPEIVAAAQGKADQHIENLRRRYGELDCPSDSSVTARPPRIAPLPPAPAGPNP